MQTARVSSIPALREFRAAIQQYVLNVQKALCEADLELDRMRDWMMHDQPAYWSMELKRRHDEVLHAKDELRRVQLSIAHNPPSAAEQKKALKVALAREQEAMTKQKACVRWQRQIDQAGNEYRGQVQHIANALDADLPRALAQLERAVSALESYVATAAPRADEDGFADRHDASAAATASAEPLDPFAVFSIESCRALRRITASISDRCSIAFPELEESQTESRERQEGRSERVILFRDRLSLPRVKPNRSDRVILDRAAIDADDIYLERIHPDERDVQTAEGDSGWFIGRAARQHATDIDPVARTVGQVLELRPEWREVLSLPHGYLVVISGGAIQRILDPHDQDLGAEISSERCERGDGSATLETSSRPERGPS